MIVAQRAQSSSAKATVINSGKGAIYGTAYSGFKHAARAYGFYKDIKPYLPETYIKKYQYKPHKRIYGQISKTKGFLKTPSRKFKQKRVRICGKYGYNGSSFGTSSNKGQSSQYCG